MVYYPKKFLLVGLVFFASGCASMYGLDKGSIPTNPNALGFLDRLEKTQYVYEKSFNYPYKEVFLASLTVVRDWGANVFIKDYDKGTIFVQPELIVNYMGAPSASIGTPGVVCGLYIQKIDETRTKVTLKAVRTTTHSFASAEDVFINIEKEIQFQRRMLQ